MKKFIKNKKVLLGLLVLVVILVTIGGTLAWFSYSKDGTRNNVIKSGSIKFHYDEKSQGITLNDAVPMTDNQGMGQSTYFEFDITAQTSNTVDIPYYITATRSGTGTNMDNVVKVYLTKVNGGVETPVEVVSGKTIATVDELGSYINNDGISIPATEKSLYNDRVLAGDTNYLQTYRLRMWIDSSAQFIIQQDGQEDLYPYQDKTYTLKVNVYSNGIDIGQTAAALRKNVDVNSLQLGNDTLVASGDSYSTEIEVGIGTTSIVRQLTVDTVNPNATVTIAEATAMNKDNSNIKRLSTSQNLTLGVTTNNYNITVTSEDGSRSKTYTLAVTVEITGYEVTLLGNNVTFSSDSVIFKQGDSSKTVTLTPSSGYYMDSISCTNGYTAFLPLGGVTGTTKILNNGYESNSVCTITTKVLSPFATDSWAEIQYNVTSGNVDRYNIGDIKTIQLTNNFTFRSYTYRDRTIVLRVANKKSCKDALLENPKLTSETACGFVVEFANVLEVLPLSSYSNAYNGGYYNTQLRYRAEDIYNAMTEDLAAVIMDTTVVAGHGKNPTNPANIETDSSGNYIIRNQKLYALDRQEVFGNNNQSGSTAGDLTRQLDYYLDYNNSKIKVANTRSGGIQNNSWWLRSVPATYDYRGDIVTNSGTVSSIGNSDNGGVSLAFRIGPLPDDVQE